MHSRTGAARRPARQRRVGRGQARARPGQQVQDALAQQARVEDLRAGPPCAAHPAGPAMHVPYGRARQHAQARPRAPGGQARRSACATAARACDRSRPRGESGDLFCGCLARSAAAASALAGAARTSKTTRSARASRSAGRPPCGSACTRRTSRAITALRPAKPLATSASDAASAMWPLTSTAVAQSAPALRRTRRRSSDAGHADHGMHGRRRAQNPVPVARRTMR